MDAFVRELLTADGSTFQNPAANYYRISRDPENSVETTAQLFLGVRIQCAKCHNHPFERWTQDDYYGFAAFFSRVRQKKGNLPDEEVIFAVKDGDVRQPRTGKTMKPKALGGPTFDPATLKVKDEDRRDQLAAWLTARDNPFFARSFVNRVWYHLMGRGIVEPVDDFRDSNPPSNEELLDGLASDFAAGGFNLKALIRSILTSQTYALSAAHQRAERGRHALLLARLHEAAAGRGLARRDFDADGLLDGVRRPAEGDAGDADPRRQDGEQLPQDLRPTRPRTRLRVRARERREPLAGPPTDRRCHGQRQAPRRRAAGSPRSPRGRTRTRRSSASCTSAPSRESRTPPRWKSPSPT